jgi:enamine deaminase RidA (YjgF/YER057c/UK114 family)
MGFEVVETPDLPTPGQFSQVVKKGNFVFISGQTAAVAASEGNLSPDDQAHEIFGYLKSAIEAAGGVMADICKINLYLTDGSQIPTIVEIRPQYFDQPYPAATLITVNGLFRRELVMEIEAIAILD